MSKNEFDDTCEQLVTARYGIVESNYNDSAFGSWYIIIDTIPNRRIVWEGRDNMLIVEEKAEELFNGSPIWKTTFTSPRLQHEKIPDLIKGMIGSP